MKLVLDIVKNGRNTPLKRNFHFDKADVSIGRSEDCDWILTDQNSYISGLHAKIIFKHGAYFIVDESINGVFLKNPYKKLPKGHPVQINTSDVFIIGDHELQARYSNNDYTQDDIVGSFDDELKSDNFIPEYNEDEQPFEEMKNSEDEDRDIGDILEAEITKSDFVGIPSEFDLTAEDDDDFDDIIGATDDIMQDHVDIPKYNVPKEKTSQNKENFDNSNNIKSSVSILEKKLGIKINSLKQEDRDALMQELGDIVLNTLNTLSNSLIINDKIKQDLRISTTYIGIDNANPVRLGSSASKLLQDINSNKMSTTVKISDAISKSINELDMHNIALYTSTKNIMKVANSRFSPKNLEYKFESEGLLRGVLPKQQLLWKAYSEMFRNLNDNPEEGVEMIRGDFIKEYETILHSLKLNSSQKKKLF